MKLFTIFAIAIFVSSCGFNATNVNKATTIPANSGPKRISTTQAASGVKEVVTLAPGASAQFVTNAMGTQYIVVNPDSKDLSCKRIKGISSEFTKSASDAGYTAEIEGNSETKGDVFFEVKNNSTKAIQTKVFIIVQDAGC